MKYEVRDRENKIFIIDYMTGFLGFSSRQSKKLVKDKKVLINGKAAYRDNRVKNGDRLEIDTAEEMNTDITPQDIPIRIIYEDESIIAVNKPPFMLVHPTPNHTSGTLLNAVAYYFNKKGIKSSLRLLNRLDMNTSGVVVIPKRAAVHSSLEEMMKAGSIRKIYTAITDGVIEPDKGMIDYPIAKDDTNPIRRIVKSDGQPSVTIYETLRKTKDHSMVRLELVTGRTHQIRVHLSYLGHPITGDELYGKASTLIGRQALHASYMELPYPCGSGVLKLEAELPEDMEILAARLGLE